MARRGRSEGSIFKAGTGQWVARLDIGFGPVGKRRRKEVRARTRREAQERLKQLQRVHDDGLPLPDERQTVSAFLVRWLIDTAAPGVRPSTYTRYRDLLKLHVIPHVGRRPLVRLSPQELQALYAKLGTSLAPRTVGHVHRVLHRALRDALRWGLVPRNVCDVVGPPRVARKEIQALGPDGARQLLKAAEGDPLEALYVLAVTAGLRQGELLGLRWADIDLDVGRLQVRRTIQRVRAEGFQEAEPKSERSRRSIALTPLAIDALRRHRVAQLHERLQAGPLWQENGFVFSNGYGRPIEAGNLLRRSYWPLLARAGLPRMRFHDLRHTAATLLLAAGTHPKVVQEMLGHSSIALTLDTYSHLIPSLQADAATRMQAILTVAAES